MKKKQLIKVKLWLLFLILIVQCSTLSLKSQTIYAIGDHGGPFAEWFLWQLDRTEGLSSGIIRLGRSNFVDGWPTGMTYNPGTGLLYVSTVHHLDNGKFLSINPETGDITDLSDLRISSGAICYYFVEDHILIQESSATNPVYITRWDEAGNFIEVACYVEGLTSMNEMAVRPSDGTIFGVGRGETSDEILFTIDIPEEANSIVGISEIGILSEPVHGLDFYPDGTLYCFMWMNKLGIVNTRTAEVSELSFVFDDNSYNGLAVGTTPIPGLIDVFIRDCIADIGSIPTVPEPPCRVAYMSPDIWIDNNHDMILDDPVYGEINRLRAKVSNREDATAMDVITRFYYRNSSSGLQFPGDATLIGEDLVTVPPHGQALASVDWDIPAPPVDGGHWCIGVVLEHPEDRIPPHTDPPAENHNNIAMANIWHIAARAGEEETLSFAMGSGDKSDLGFDSWPRLFVLEADVNLPEDWIWEIEGAAIGDTILINLGEERKITFKVTPPSDARAHSGGSVDIRQVDVLTQHVVGGLMYRIYEDNMPPNPVTGLYTSMVNGYTMLNWDEVTTEKETDWAERVSYYEVIRNGKAVAKAVIDQDPDKPGYQWVDSTKVKFKATYSLRAVDNGENISEHSPEVSIKSPAIVWNWIIIILIIIILILLVQIRRGRKSTA